jgi:hypothetical protein
MHWQGLTRVTGSCFWTRSHHLHKATNVGNITCCLKRRALPTQKRNQEIEKKFNNSSLQMTTHMLYLHMRVQLGDDIHEAIQ